MIKVFSIFKEHTEWINKGKAGVPQILGKNVCILRDQYQLILHHRVMDREADVEVAVPVVEEARERFPDLNSCSFDKGFRSPENREKLGCVLAGVILPKKGKLTLKQKIVRKKDGILIICILGQKSEEDSFQEKGPMERQKSKGILCRYLFSHIGY